MRPVERTRVMFLYWGRRGALSRFTLELGRAALENSGLASSVCVSRQNENIADFAELGSALFPIDTFRNSTGAVLQAWRIPLIRRQLLAHLVADRTQVVVDLMPHVWSPAVASTVRQAGCRHAIVVHDADPHPGDKTSLVNGLLDRVVSRADLIVTLSGAVAGRLEATGRVPRSKLTTLFHPDLYVDKLIPRTPPAHGEPLRLLFLGRILSYKGLPLFLDAVNILQERGIPVEIGVFGEGRLGSSTARLKKMGAEVVNRWLTDAEIAPIMARYHAVVLSHTEASQSGVAAAAFGVGIPVIATPVGGLVEQVIDGFNGARAARADADGLAEAAQRLLLDPAAYAQVCRNIVESRERRSMARFVKECVSRTMRVAMPA